MILRALFSQLPKRILMVRGVDALVVSMSLGVCLYSAHGLFQEVHKGSNATLGAANRGPASAMEHGAPTGPSRSDDLVDVGCLDLYGPRPVIQVHHSQVRLKAALCDTKNLKTLKNNHLWKSTEVKSLKNKETIFVYEESTSDKRSKVQNISTEFISFEQGMNEINFTLIQNKGSATITVAIEKQ